MPLRLLHISDIHFHSTTPGWDEDFDLRAELVRDVRALVDHGGPVDAVLVGGDIAFSASEAEYAIALQWIDEILHACGGIDRSRVWTVPGNHDIDRSVVDGSAEIQKLRYELATCDPIGGVDEVFRRRVAQSDNADALMLQFQEYNRFAEAFLCTTSPTSLAWEDTSLSVDGLTVRLTGINSVMNSGSGDQLNTLVVGTQQCRLRRADETIQIAMLHHPPQWIRDWASIEPYLNRAHVVLFGHEHAFEAEQQLANGSVRVSAGAVAPERDEHGEVEPYVPTYNLLTLERATDQVRVEIQPRYWSKHGTRFAEHPDGVREFYVNFDPAVETVTMTVEDVDMGIDQAISTASPLIAPQSEGGGATTEESAAERTSLRAVGVEYLALPILKRLSIARNLGVLNEDEMSLPARELYPLILGRVREQGLVDALIAEMKS